MSDILMITAVVASVGVEIPNAAHLATAVRPEA